jgi:cell division protein FtsL
MFLRRALIAAIPAACIVTVIYGRMQLLEATVQRSYLNASIRQELNKQQVLHSELLNATKPEQIDQFAKEQGLVLQVTPPMYVAARVQRKGR